MVTTSRVRGKGAKAIRRAGWRILLAGTVLLVVRAWYPNCFLTGEHDAAWAAVHVDGRFRGWMLPDGCGGTQLWLRVGRGSHSLEVRRSGFQPVWKRFSVRGSWYGSIAVRAERARPRTVSAP